MQPFDVELARQGLRVYAETVSPEYDQLRQRLVGHLAANGVQIDQLRANEAQLASNFDLVSGFMGLLPHSDSRFYRSSQTNDFEASDAHTARQVHANIVWLNEKADYSDRRGTTSPYYIIGRRGDASHEYDYGRGPVTHLLLFSAYDSDRPLKTITVWQNEFEIMEKAATEAMYNEFTPDELRSMFDPDTGNLCLFKRPDSIATALSDSHILQIQSRFRDITTEVAKKGMKAKIHGGGYTKQTRITDRTLAEFDVFSHLNRLATAFGNISELDTLLKNYAQSIPKDPLDAIIADNTTAIEPPSAESVASSD